VPLIWSDNLATENGCQIWNMGFWQSLYEAGSLKTVSSQLTKYN